MSVTVRVGGIVVGVLSDFRASLCQYPADLPTLPLTPRSGPYVAGVGNWSAGSSVLPPLPPKQES